MKRNFALLIASALTTAAGIILFTFFFSAATDPANAEAVDTPIGPIEEPKLDIETWQRQVEATAQAARQ